MNDQVEFLRARFGEEEALALSVPGPVWEHRQIRGHFDEDVVFEDYVAVAETDTSRVVLSDVGPEVVQYVVHNDPARALAEVESKRARVGVAIAVLSGNLLGVEPSGDPDIDAAGLMGAQAMAKLMLKIELMPYVKHPEYKQEWSA